MAKEHRKIERWRCMDEVKGGDNDDDEPDAGKNEEKLLLSVFALFHLNSQITCREWL